jgi:predicted nucleic acid-binding protein
MRGDATDMPFVLDASVTLGWCFRDEQQYLIDTVSTLMEDGEQARVPLIWWFEIRQAALTGLKRKRVTEERVIDFLAEVGGKLIAIAPLPASSSLLDLARRHNLSFYDAAYLELAQRENIALATLDQALARAAAAEGVPLVAA